MKNTLSSLLVAALAGPLLCLSLQARAIDIKITNNDNPDPSPCRLHMGTTAEDALQTDPQGQDGDLMVRGTFSTGDPCISIPPTQPPPVPTGNVSLPQGSTPMAGVPFNVNWYAQSAGACQFIGTGWSGDACGGSKPACNPIGASGTQSLTLVEGFYTMGLKCSNDSYPAIIVATTPPVRVRAAPLPPTGTVSLPPGTTPTAGVPFAVNWTAQNALTCSLTGNGWSGDACGGTKPACNPQGSSGTQSLTLVEGSYNMALTCSNGVDPAITVASKSVVVAPTATCGYNLPPGTTARQVQVNTRFNGFTTTYKQPAYDFKGLFGFGNTCVPSTGGACTNLTPFNGVNGMSNWFQLKKSEYISLKFDPATAPPALTSFRITINGSSNNAPQTVTTVSTRCGDFDDVTPGSFLSENPVCINRNTRPERPFSFTLVNNPNVCTVQRGTTYYLNIHVTECNDAGTTCTILYNND